MWLKGGFRQEIRTAGLDKPSSLGPALSFPTCFCPATDTFLLHRLLLSVHFSNNSMLHQKLSLVYNSLILSCANLLCSSSHVFAWSVPRYAFVGTNVQSKAFKKNKTPENCIPWATIYNINHPSGSWERRRNEARERETGGMKWEFLERRFQVDTQLYFKK